MFNARRLELARKRRGFTKVALAAALNISLRAYGDYEAGHREPSQVLVELMAAILAFPAGFFAGEDIHLPGDSAVTFRARASLTARDRDRALGGMSLAFLLADYAEASFNLPTMAIPDLSGMQPEGAAMTLRNEWELGQRPIANMLDLLESRGVRVFSLIESVKDVDAFATWRGNSPYVFLNLLKSAERSRFDAAHELGHLVMHRTVQPDPRKTEQEANRFAGALLMPAAATLAALSQGIAVDSLMQAKQHFGVSIMAMTHRLFELGKIHEWQYNTLCVKFSQLGYRTTEPNPMPSERSQVWDQVFDLLRKEDVSKSAVAARLHLNVRDVEELVFGLTMTQVAGGATERASGMRPDSRPALHIV